MKFGLPISFAIHFLAVSGGMLFWNSAIDDVPAARIIPLKLVTVSERTNIKPTRKKPTPGKPETVAPAPKPTPDPDPVKPAEVLAPKDDKPVVTDEPPAEVVNEAPAPVTPAEEAPPPAFNLDALSDMVSKARTDKPDVNVQKILIGEIPVTGRDQTGAGEASDQTVSAPDYIKAKMKPCWPIDRGAKDYQKLRVEVRLLLGENGEINSLTVINGAQIIASPNNAWRAARDKVIAGLYECAPYDGLKTLDYTQWKNMKLNFQPGDTE